MTAFDDYEDATQSRAGTKRHDKDSALRRAMRRNTYASAGLLGLLSLAAIAASLVSWQVTDPSLSNATEHVPRNILGMPGAILSDLLIQAFGLATAFILIPPTIWFWRLVRLEPMRLSRQKAMAWIGGLGAIAIAFSSVPAPASWPLPMSLGGMIGDGFLTVISRLDATFMQGLGAVLVGAAAASFGAILMLNAADLSLRSLIPTRKRGDIEIIEEEGAALHDEEDWEDEELDDPYTRAAGPDGSLDRTKLPSNKSSTMLAIPLGALSHWYLSYKAARHRETPKSARRDQATVRSRPSLLTRLLGEEDDGLDAFADRMEPQVHGRPAQPYPSGHHAQRPTPAEMGYGGPQDFAPAQNDSPPPADAYGDEGYGADDTIPWEDEPVFDTPPDDQPIGVAPPELNRQPAQKQERAVTNETAQSKPGKPNGISSKRMVKSPQGNLFMRKEAYQMPTLDFLSEPESLGANAGLTADQLEHNARLLEGVLSDFGIRGEIIKVRPGPVVTLYELEPAPGIKSSRVIGLADDIARSMSAISARVAVVQGRNAIGIELPNARRETVFLREMLASKDFEKSKAKLPICLGKNISGDPVVVDLARMPHVLVAGTTGSGKSVSINTTIMSLLYRHKPEECRLIMIDPKMLELSIYDGIPHLLTPVVTDPAKAVVALKWAVREMEQRYKNMSKMGVRNIDGFNKRVRDSLAKGEDVTRTIQTGFDPETGDPIYEQESLDLEPMPYIVVVVDEMADLMMVAGKDIEGAIQRLAQMARAAGIHLIMATQRPSVDVITGTIKANFPTRMSFQVTSKIDSRTILGEMGAEQLLGMGDMLYMAGGGTHPACPWPLRLGRRGRADCLAPQIAGSPGLS